MEVTRIEPRSTSEWTLVGSELVVSPRKDGSGDVSFLKTTWSNRGIVVADSLLALATMSNEGVKTISHNVFIPKDANVDQFTNQWASFIGSKCPLTVERILLNEAPYCINIVMVGNDPGDVAWDTYRAKKISALAEEIKSAITIFEGSTINKD